MWILLPPMNTITNLNLVRNHFLLSVVFGYFHWTSWVFLYFLFCSAIYIYIFFLLFIYHPPSRHRFPSRLPLFSLTYSCLDVSQKLLFFSFFFFFCSPVFVPHKQWFFCSSRVSKLLSFKSVRVAQGAKKRSKKKKHGGATDWLQSLPVGHLQ